MVGKYSQQNYGQNNNYGNTTISLDGVYTRWITGKTLKPPPDKESSQESEKPHYKSYFRYVSVEPLLGPLVFVEIPRRKDSRRGVKNQRVPKGKIRRSVFLPKNKWHETLHERDYRGYRSRFGPHKCRGNLSSKGDGVSKIIETRKVTLGQWWSLGNERGVRTWSPKNFKRDTVTDKGSKGRFSSLVSLFLQFEWWPIHHEEKDITPKVNKSRIH